MERLTTSLVFKQLPVALKSLLLGAVFGSALSYLLYNFNKVILELILSLWIKRILLGINLLGEKYSVLWFILNNVVALLLIVAACILIVIHVSKTPEYVITKKLGLKKQRQKIILFGLYLIPLGALAINSFFISLFSVYVLLSFGLEKFLLALALLFPHGINEIVALLLASSLALAYLHVLKPIILKGKWKLAIRRGKKLLASRVTLFFIVLILLLIVFSGFLEGILSLFLK